MKTASSELDIDRLASSYSAVLFARRICQLYFFMLVFELLLGVYNVALDLFTWCLNSFTYLMGSGPMPAFPEMGDVNPSASLSALAILAPAWLAYYIYSDFRRAWWIIPIAAAALCANVYAGYLNAISYEMEWGGREALSGASTRQLTAYLYMSGLVPLHALFLLIAYNAQRAIYRLTPEETRILSEYQGQQKPWLSSLRSLVNIPEAIRYARGRVWSGLLMIFAGVANFMNFWRATVVFIFVCLVPAIAQILFPNIDVVINALLEWRNMRQVAMDLSLVAIILGIYLAITMIIPWLVAVLARLAVQRAENRMRTSLEEIQHKDERAPVLFLRSFLNDKVPLSRTKRSLKQWLLDGAGSLDTLDMMILAEGTRIGPTVALGNPDDPAPPYGVARGYFDHDNWKEAVMGLCERSAAIVLVLDKTEGVEWEIGHIAGKKYLSKTLFLLAPEDVGAERGIALLSDAMARATGKDEADMRALLADMPGKAALGFMVEDGALQMLKVEEPKQYTYLATVRRFLRQLP